MAEAARSDSPFAEAGELPKNPVKESSVGFCVTIVPFRVPFQFLRGLRLSLRGGLGASKGFR